MDSESSSLNPSSLLDLKAELHKKYESFKREKLSQKSDSVRTSTFKYKGQPKPKERKLTSKVILNSEDDTGEEELALKKSQLALEAKAKLYEKITSSNILIDDEDNEKYLVDFHRKVLYSTPIPAKTENESYLEAPEENSSACESSQCHKEMLDKKSLSFDYQNNKKIEVNLTDQPIHYQNVQFNEVRDHGTGYFAFSMDESERKVQMEELTKLRQQTEEQRLATQRMQRKRKAMLEARLAKVCERRNIDKGVVQTYTKTQENSEDLEIEKDVDLSSIPLPETEMPEEKVVKIRPWDIGKTNFTPFVPEKQKLKSQRNWIDEKRGERPSEFAPPSSYF